MKNPNLYNKNQRGQAIVLIAVLMVALIASLGLAIDGGGMFLLYRDVQNATDAAGLSAAFQMCTGGDPLIAIEESAELNGFVDGVDGVTITVQHPPGNLLDPSSPYIGQAGYIALEIKSVKPAYFIQVVYDGPLEVSAVTVAQCRRPQDNGLMPNAGIVTLKDTCQNINDAGVTGTGNNTTVVVGSVYSNVPVGCTGFELDGSSQWIVTGTVCSDGAIDSGVLLATIQTPCSYSSPGTDPLGMIGNEPYCDRSINHGSLGSYAGVNGPAPAGFYTDFTTKPNEEVILSSGIYCTTNDIDLKGLVTTAPGGVTIFMDCTNCGFSTNANRENHLLPQTSGPYAGLLFYSPTSNRNPGGIKMNGKSNSDIQGTVYAPNASCSIQGANDTVINAQLICWDYFSAGTSEVTIYHNPAAAFTPPSTFGITE